MRTRLARLRGEDAPNLLMMVAWIFALVMDAAVGRWSWWFLDIPAIAATGWVVVRAVRLREEQERVKQRGLRALEMLQRRLYR